MNKQIVIGIIIEIVEKLVVGDFSSVVENDYYKRIPEGEVRLAIIDYPGILSMPPLEAFKKMDFYTVNENYTRIDMDLWYDSEQSDNTLSCSVVSLEGVIRYGIDAIHVL